MGGQLQHHPQVLCLFGELAAGKTTFVKGLAEGTVGAIADSVNSPTFTYLQIYEGQGSFYHFDLYRMQGVENFLGMGFDDYLESETCCFEWSERIKEILPDERIDVLIEHRGRNRREITITDRRKDGNLKF